MANLKDLYMKQHQLNQANLEMFELISERLDKIEDFLQIDEEKDCQKEDCCEEAKEEYQLTPNMQAFFDKLLELKKYCEKEAYKIINVDCKKRLTFIDIWERLDDIIKEKQ